MTEELRQRLEALKGHVMTPQERFEQRVSFVYGNQSSKTPGLTKDQIRQHMIDIEGYPGKDAI